MYELFSYTASYVRWSPSDFLQAHSMIDEKDFRIDFSLKNISVMSKFVARDAKMKRLKKSYHNSYFIKYKLNMLNMPSILNEINIIIYFA